ncbi:MAG: beta-N-acetylhexosaminidase [Paraclostridium sp.]|uniref:beta-N-acetylhexosaminidase n=1 Tax=Paraclostridium sp. TaxID=2023273 RepID=UPI003F362612
MRRITGKKADIINSIFGISMFLLMGLIRPVLVYFFNIDLIIPMVVLMLIICIFILIFVKEEKRNNVYLFDRAVNIFILGSILFICKNESNIFTPVLTFISCILILIEYNNKFKTDSINGNLAVCIIIFSIGIIFTCLIQDFLGFSNLYNEDKEYKSCRIIKELEVPINAKERNYNINIDNVKDYIGYRIQDINIYNNETLIYIEKLQSDGWKVIEVKHFDNKDIYVLLKDEKKVVLEIKENSLIIGVIEDLEKDKHIKDKIKKMTLDEKIGQMIIAGFNGTEVNEEVNRLVKDMNIGGIILFSRNIENSNQLKKLTNDIKKSGGNSSLFISIDEEGGRVSRLPSDTTKFKSSREIGDSNDINYAYENGKNLGKTLKEHNINMDFAPVLDIYSNPKNTVIGDRAFGSDAKKVSKMGIATMNGIKEENIIPVIKHFPGHGDTELDSHFGLPSVSKSLEELQKFELVPFEEAIESGADVVMVSHILIEKIDNQNPATLSKKVIVNLLRDKLGFEGVVITDDMLMKAVTNNITIESASVKSINAGSDIILIGSGIDNTKSVINKIKSAVENKEISEERINESLYRILKLKEKFSI